MNELMIKIYFGNKLKRMAKIYIDGKEVGRMKM